MVYFFYFTQVVKKEDEQKYLNEQKERSVYCAQQTLSDIHECSFIIIIIIIAVIIKSLSSQSGLHKLWYPGIRDRSTWGKFGAHGEHGDVFPFSNLGAL